MLREESSAVSARSEEGVEVLMLFVAPSIWSGSCWKVWDMIVEIRLRGVRVLKDVYFLD